MLLLYEPYQVSRAFVQFGNLISRSEFSYIGILVTEPLIDLFFRYAVTGLYQRHLLNKKSDGLISLKILLMPIPRAVVSRSAHHSPCIWL